MRRTSLALAAVSLLALAACGGDNGANRPTNLPAQIQDALDDADDGVVQGLADLAEEGGDLEELLEGLDEMISTFGGDGGGSVSVDGVTYTVTAEICLVEPASFVIDGPASGSDGSVAWVSVDFSITTRAEMEEIFDESTIEFMFPDGVDVIEVATVDVGVGQSTRFESIDSQPSWSASSDAVFGFGGELDYQRTQRGLRGSGQATDFNGVAIPFGDTAPIEFDVACS